MSNSPTRGECTDRIRREVAQHWIGSDPVTDELAAERREAARREVDEFLDASALSAWLRREHGAEQVDPALSESVISAVNPVDPVKPRSRADPQSRSTSEDRVRPLLCATPGTTHDSAIGPQHKGL